MRLILFSQFLLLCMQALPAQTTDYPRVFPKAFFSAQVGLAWPGGDLPQDGAERATDFQAEYPLLQRNFGLGCTFLKAKHGADLRNADPKQFLLFNGTLKGIGNWEYQAFVIGPVIAVPFGHKHPGAIYVKAQGGLLHAKCASRYYDTKTLYDVYDNALALHLGMGMYWTIAGPIALTAGGSVLKGKTEFAMPSDFPSSTTTLNRVDFSVARLGLGLLLWL